MPIRPFPALLLRRGSKRVMVIVDLHIGWEAALAERGIHIPSQTPKILEKIIQLIKNHKPTTLIVLGDVKHTIAKAEMEEWRDIPDFFEKIGEMVQEVQVIPGNHDGNLAPLLPESVEIFPSNGVVLFGDTGLFHGHTWPAPELLECQNLIIGHVHPIIVVRDPLGFRISRPVWVKARCNGAGLARSLLKHLKIKGVKNPVDSLRDRFDVELRSTQLLIMPSFNEFLGGQSMNRRSRGKNATSKMFISPVLRSESIDINNAELYLLDGTFLGSITQLRTVSS